VTLLRVGLVLAAAVAATVVANVVLLGVATGSGGPGTLPFRAPSTARPPATQIKPLLPESPAQHGEPAEREHDD
jgi:hypothetical protein